LPAVNAAGKNLVQQGVVAVIGSYASDMTEALQGILNEATVIQISYGSTAVHLTEKGLKYFFRTCPRDDEQARAAKKVMQKMKIKKAALIHDGSLYGKGLAESIAQQLKGTDVDIVFYEALVPGQDDYLPLLEKVKEEAPEMVFFAGYYLEAAKILLARQQMKWKVIMMGGDAVNNADLVSRAGKKAAEGFYFLSPPGPDDIDLAGTKKFLERYKKEYGYKMTTIEALLAADAFTALLQSISRVKTTDPDRVSRHLRRSYINKKGLTGAIGFDYKGDLATDLHAIYRVDAEGRFVLQRLLQYGNIIK